jgi:hypothetical protein
VAVLIRVNPWQSVIASLSHSEFRLF